MGWGGVAPSRRICVLESLPHGAEATRLETEASPSHRAFSHETCMTGPAVGSGQTISFRLVPVSRRMRSLARISSGARSRPGWLRCGAVQAQSSPLWPVRAGCLPGRSAAALSGGARGGGLLEAPFPEPLHNVSWGWHGFPGRHASYLGAPPPPPHVGKAFPATPPAGAPLGGLLPGFTRGVLRELDFFFCQGPPLGTAPRDHQPPTINRHQPPTANRHQPPTTNRRFTLDHERWCGPQIFPLGLALSYA